MSDRDEILKNLNSQIADKNYAFQNTTDQGLKDALGLEIAGLMNTMDSMMSETPEQRDVGLSPSNIGEAVLNRLPESLGNTGQAFINLVNMPFAGVQRDEQGFAVRDELTGKPLQKEPLINFDLAATLKRETPTSDIVGEGRMATAIDYGTDAMVFSLPMTPAMGFTAKGLSKIPKLNRITDPFAEFKYGRDMMYGGIGGAAGGFFADEEGNSSLVAELLTPLAAQFGGGGIKQLFSRLTGGKYQAGISSLEDEVAGQILKKALDDSGLSVDEAIEQFQRSGPEGLLGDVDDAFRFVLREARAQGELSGTQNRALRTRVEGDRANLDTTGRTGRLNDAIGRELGSMDGATYIRNLDAQRSDEIRKLYAQAWEGGLEPIPPKVQTILDVDSPDMQKAIRDAEIMQLNENGTKIFSNNFDYINYIKMSLDDQISSKLSGIDPSSSQRNRVRSLIELKNRLVTAADEAYPGYQDARNAFAGVAALKDKVELGRNIFGRNMDSDLLIEAQTSMSVSERNAFKVGARDALLDLIANTPLTGNPATRLIRTPEIVNRLKTVFEGDDLNTFLDAIAREGEFLRTRNVVGGGSQSFDKYAQSQALHQNVRGVIAAGLDPTNLSQFQMFSNLLTRLTTDKREEIYKGGLRLASDILMNSNLDANAVRVALTNDNVRQLIPNIALSIWGAEALPKNLVNAIRGMTVAEAADWARGERDKLEREAERNPSTDIPARYRGMVEDTRRQTLGIN